MTTPPKYLSVAFEQGAGLTVTGQFYVWSGGGWASAGDPFTLPPSADRGNGIYAYQAPLPDALVTAGGGLVEYSDGVTGDTLKSETLAIDPPAAQSAPTEPGGSGTDTGTDSGQPGSGQYPGALTMGLNQFGMGGDPFASINVAARNAYPISLDGIRAKLVGLDSWLDAAAKQRVPYDDARIIKNIPAMLKRFERETTIQVRGCQVVTRDDGTYTQVMGGKVVGSNGLPLKKEEAYTYYPDSAYSYFLTSLKTRPVQQVQRCRIMFKDTTVLEIPPEWYDVDGQSGQFAILPVQGSLLFAEYSSTFALLQAGFQNRDFIPHVVQFDYVAGLPDGWEEDDDHADLLRCLEEFCALAVLNDVAHLADAGLSGKSVSGGGTGESYQYTRFADRKAELTQSVKDFVDIWKGQESPFMMAGL